MQTENVIMAEIKVDLGIMQFILVIIQSLKKKSKGKKFLETLVSY